MSCAEGTTTVLKQCKFHAKKLYDVRLSVYSCGTIRLPLDVLSWKSILGIFTKVCVENSSLFKSDKTHTFHEHLLTFMTSRRDWSLELKVPLRGTHWGPTNSFVIETDCRSILCEVQADAEGTVEQRGSLMFEAVFVNYELWQKKGFGVEHRPWSIVCLRNIDFESPRLRHLDDDWF